ncbi:MAG: tetratricopeptide repeat protein [Pirellulaceae bacterium]|nr:tetratricopeptide repeat protein [Pirellulaceae bacterium]
MTQTNRDDISLNDRLAHVSWLVERYLCLLGKLGGLAKRDAKAWVAQRGGMVLPLSDPRVTDIVVGDDSFPFNLRELDDGVVERIENGAVRLWEETEFWQQCGLLEDPTHTTQLYTPAMLADLLKIPVRTIRRWHRLGLLHPIREVYRLPYFDFQELAAARRLASWLQSTSPEQVEQQLVKLTRVLPGARRPLSQLPIIVQGKEVLLRQMSGLVDPNGQLRFDFEQWGNQEELPAARILALSDRVAETAPFARLTPTDWSDFRPRSSEECLQQAIEFEDAQDWPSALNVYRCMQLAFGPSADVCFQIGELLYRTGELTAARERYSMAVELDTEFLEARANLGCVLMELQQWDLALAAFEGALDLHPDYVDVLFHAAAACEKLGRLAESHDYWERFVRLAPNSPWAQYAHAKLSNPPPGCRP